MKKSLIFISLICLILGFVSCTSEREQGWPTYRHDGARSGTTTDTLSSPLYLNWVYKPAHAPNPAWYKPSEELPRMHDDNAYYVSAAEGMAYFGCSVDNKVYALDILTGEEKWTYFTQGPVRFAPSIYKGKVYFGSDDGYVYCLKARKGKLIWKFRAGPEEKRILGNERMISLWPVRTSVLVDKGIVYFGAGVFPYEGLYICALDADNGKIIWMNDTMGDRTYELIYSGISPHGYLIASDSILYVPSGRAMPAAFSKTSGKFLYYLSPEGKSGGTWGLVTDNTLIAGVERSGIPVKTSYDKTGERKGDVFASFNGSDMVVTTDISCVLTEKGIYAIDRIKYPAIKEKLENIRKQRNEEGGNFYKYSNVIFSHVTRRAGPMYNGYVDIEPQELDEQFDELLQLFFKLDKEEEKLKAAASKWEYYREGLNTLIFSGNQVFAGGDDIVVALNAQTGQELWHEEIQGKALGLAVSDGCLIVCTDKGPVYCFGKKESSEVKEISPKVINEPYSQDRFSSIYNKAAENILTETGINKGYCLLLDCDEGHLAYLLAKKSKLYIIGIEKDPNKIKIARENLDAAGLYGSRIIVEDWDISDLPDYFANLIVSDNMIISGKITSSSGEMFRVLKPCGGVICLGQPEKTKNKISKEKLVEWLKSATISESEITTTNGLWAKVIRGKLKDSGSWTSLYGNSANTGCSDDELVKAPFRTLWFGKPGPEKMVERHAKAMSPVAMDGRMFIQGENIIMAYDSYNGVLLWENEIPGAFRVYADVDGGNLAITKNGLFVAAYDKCFQLDPESGETLHTFKIPGSSDDKPRRWAYVACNGNTLFGSAAMPFDQDYNQVWRNIVRENGTWKNSDEVDPGYAAALDFYKAKCPSPEKMALSDFQRGSIKWAYMTEFPLWDGSRMRANEGPDDRLMFSDAIFAIDIKTTIIKWIYRGEKIAHNTISIENGNVFFADASVTKTQWEKAINKRQTLIKQGIWEGYKDEVAPEDIDVRSIIALDASTGEMQWQKAVDLTGCGGNATASAYKNNILLFFGSYGLHDKWRYAAGQIEWRRITALSAKNGEPIWSRPLNYMVRPVIVGDEIIIEPRACDLYTGEIKMRTHPITGKQVPWEFLRPGHGCNNISASPNCLFYRSDVSAFYDLEKDRGINYYGSIRPGCWINMIPANGLLLYPEASSGCTCSYPLKSTVVLIPEKPDKVEDWSIYISQDSLTPVQHLAINLGAPGDRTDNNGIVWFGYPRQQVEYGVKFDLDEKVLEGMGFFYYDVRGTKIENTDKPWLFTSGCIGLSQCNIPLINESLGEKPAGYTVRLGFAVPTGKHVFDIRLQDITVLENFDILKLAGSANRAIVKEFKGIKVKDNLKLELIPKVSNSEMKQAPVINFIEIIREN